MEIAKRLVCLLFLYVLAWQDHKRKEVSTGLLYLFLGIGIFFRMIQGTGSGWLLLADLFPGCMLLLAGAVSKEQIGYGDGLAVLALGALEGGVFTLYAMTIGFWLAAVCILAGRLRRTAEEVAVLRIPYLPFLLIGTVVITGVS